MWHPVKARALWLLGAALALAGVLLVLHALGLFLWQYFVAHEGVIWLLDRVHLGAVSGLLGLLAAAAGVLLALRQQAVLDGFKRLKEDRLRRLRAYRGQ